jgi:MFS family permease
MGTIARSRVRRLAVSRVISITGGAASFLALNFTIYQRTGSAVWLAASLFLTFGTEGFVSPFAGALADRFDRRRVMIASDLVAALFFFAMALVRSPAPLLALAFCSAVAETPFLSASAAAIPNLVEDQDDLGWANGLVTLGRNGGILVGPLVGGLLLSWVGAGAVFAGNAVTFLISAALVASIRGRFSEDRTDGGEFAGLRAGFRFLARDRVLRILALAWLALVLGLGMTMVADVPLVTLFHAGSWGYGVLISCWGAGSILGSLMGRRLDAANETLWFVLGSVGVAATSVAVGVSPWFALVLGSVLVMGVGDAVSLVAQQGVLQRRTPDAVRSRVSGAFDSVVHVGLALSYAAGGGAVAWLGPRGVYVAGGLAAGVGAVIAVSALRQSGRDPKTLRERAAPLETVEHPDPSAYIVD